MTTSSHPVSLTSLVVASIISSFASNIVVGTLFRASILRNSTVQPRISALFVERLPHSFFRNVSIIKMSCGDGRIGGLYFDHSLIIPFHCFARSVFFMVICFSFVSLSHLFLFHMVRSVLVLL